MMFSFATLDGLLDGATDLVVPAFGVADVAVAVTDGTDAAELDTPTGVGHALDHVDVQHFVFESGEELVDDLGFLERKTGVRALPPSS